MRYLSLALTLACVISQTPALCESAESPLAHFVGTTFLSQFSAQKQTTQTLKASFGWTKLGEFSLAQMSPFEKYAVAYAMAVPSSVPHQAIIDTLFIDKMEIVRGGQCKEDSLLSHITTVEGTSVLSTFFGEAHLAHMLTNPCTDHVTISNRQEALKLLTENPKLLNRIKKQLHIIRDAQDTFFLAWHELDAASAGAIKAYVGVPFFPSLNKRTAIVETWRRIHQFLFIAPSLLSLVASPTVHYLALSTTQPFLSRRKKLLQAIASPYHNFKNAGTEGKIVSACLWAYWAYSSTQCINAMLFTQKLANYLHSQVNAIAQVRTAMRNLAKITQAHPVLARGIPSLIHLIDVDNGHNHSASFVKLWNMLDSNTFKHEPTTFSIQGRAIAAYHIMQEVKGEFAPMLHAVGELDAFAAVATVFKFHRNKPAHFSFATIINSYTPYLKATNFWHPCLDPEHAITNTVEISADTSPNIVITGPNTGGKTTILKALLANILLAQTFGICTGELELAPYARIHCHMNLTDDIASGTSLFKAEVNHAKKLIESVKGLREGEFAFIVMDEAFRSTAPEQGEQASYKFAAQLAQNKQSNFLIATHYHKLTDLESDLKGAFRNYHVGIILHDDGSFTRTFQFERGASTVNIALALLKEEGVLW